MTMLVGILLALAGWSLSRTFDLSTIQAVHEDKVHTLQQQVLKLEDQVDGMMDKDKEIIEQQVLKLEDQVDNMMDKDEEIIEQHKKLFEVLGSNQPTTGYNY